MPEGRSGKLPAGSRGGLFSSPPTPPPSGQPLGGALGGMFGNAQWGAQIGGGIGQLGRLLPFTADPVTNAYVQQAQLAQQQAQLVPQGLFGNLLGSIGQPLGGAIGGIFGNPQLGGQIGGGIGQLGRLLPFTADPVTNAYVQQAQLAQQQAQLVPQGLFENGRAHV